MKRMLMLAALAAVGLVGCKGSDRGAHLQGDMPMVGAKAKTEGGNVVQTAYRPTGTQGVQQAGGAMTPGQPSVVQAGGGAATCPNGMCPNGMCDTQMPMTAPVR
jgi:hypothetical protein